MLNFKLYNCKIFISLFFRVPLSDFWRTTRGTRTTGWKPLM